MNVLALQRPRLMAYVSLCGLSMAVGWVYRDTLGGEAGALFPGALAALAIALVTPDPRKRARVASLCIVGAIGTAICGGLPYDPVAMRLVHGDDTFRAIVALVGRGALWGGFAGAVLGMALSRARYRARDLLWLAPVAAFWAFTGHVPHGDDLSRGDMTWVLAGSLAALVLWLWTCKQDRSAVFMGFCGAAGFGLGAPVAFALFSCTSPADSPVDWWRVAQLPWGFLGGAAIGVGAYALDEAGEGPRESSHEGAGIAGLALVAWWLPVRNLAGYVTAAIEDFAQPDLALALCVVLAATLLVGVLSVMTWRSHPPTGRRASAGLYLWLLWAGFATQHLVAGTYRDGVALNRISQAGLACAFLVLTCCAVALGRRRQDRNSAYSPEPV